MIRFLPSSKSELTIDLNFSSTAHSTRIWFIYLPFCFYLQSPSYLQSLRLLHAAYVHRLADHGSRLPVERDLVECILHRGYPPLRIHAKHDVAGQLGGPSLRWKTLRQVSSYVYIVFKHLFLIPIMSIFSLKNLQ